MCRIFFGGGGERFFYYLKFLFFMVVEIKLLFRALPKHSKDAVFRFFGPALSLSRLLHSGAEMLVGNKSNIYNRVIVI